VVGRSLPNEYAELNQLVKERGLLDKQTRYYAGNVLLTLVLLGLGLAFLAVANALWLQLLDAVFLAIVFARIAFLGHDAGHRQIFRTNRKNDIAGLLISFLLGMERTWWVEKHNRHHSNPNQPGLDPDIDIPVLAFTEEEAVGKRGLYRFTTRYQAHFFYPLLCLEGGIGLRLAGLQYMLHHKLKYPVVEPLLMVGHLAAYLGLLFWLLEPWHAAIFIALHQLLFGLHMGSAFAPNHKGMPILDATSRMDYVRQQVLTARNLRGNPVVDFLYGGLNYQIEHHLFPNMARNKLSEARKIVKKFCQDRSIPYHETGVMRSQREILAYLHRVSAPLGGRDG
jgi:fatty acid desaturase